MKRIPVYQPSLVGNEKKYVNECLDSGWISSKGDFVNKFEEVFRKRINVNHALTVCNGTVAIHLALEAVGVTSGDEVIVPSLTYVASANAIKYTGAKPVFVDSLYTTWQMNPDDIERKITPRTKAILVVHLYGYPCDMDRILQISKKYGLLVIEDCAEAFGSVYEGRHVGTLGDVGTFSFFGNKTITTGEGGMVVTNDSEIANKLERLKAQGVSSWREYWHDLIGYNYRMTNICAAIGLAQIESADDVIARKVEIADLYQSLLKTLPVKFQEPTKQLFNSFWMVCFLVDNQGVRDALRQHLEGANIETRPVFYPVHSMPIYENGDTVLPVCEDIGYRGINLPSWPGLEDEDIHRVCGEISKFFSTYGQLLNS